MEAAMYALQKNWRESWVYVEENQRNIGEKAGFMWKRIRGIFPSNSEAPSIVAPGGPGEESKVGREIQKWVPHLYVNNSDYICCYYTDPAAPNSSGNSEKPKADTVGDVAAAKFLEAHGLEQWWSSDMELQSAINQSRLINQQLKKGIITREFFPFFGQTKKGLKDRRWLAHDQNIYIPYYVAHIIGSYTMNMEEFTETAVHAGVIAPLVELLRGRFTWVEQRVAIRALGHLATYRSTFPAVGNHGEVLKLSIQLALSSLEIVYSHFYQFTDRRLKNQCDR
ncbi:hypothetical protein ACLOJK_038194 [Asimina triloba]